MQVRNIFIPLRGELSVGLSYTVALFAQDVHLFNVVVYFYFYFVRCYVFEGIITTIDVSIKSLHANQRDTLYGILCREICLFAGNTIVEGVGVGAAFNDDGGRKLSREANFRKYKCKSKKNMYTYI